MGRQTLTKRDYFPTDEYKRLVETIEQLAGDGVTVSGVLVTLEFKYLVHFMVNPFIRPSDLRVLDCSTAMPALQSWLATLGRRKP